MERGRKPHVAQQKGTGRPYCSSVGKSGIEAHFLNEGISIVRTVQSGKNRRLALQP